MAVKGRKGAFEERGKDLVCDSIRRQRERERKKKKKTLSTSTSTLVSLVSRSFPSFFFFHTNKQIVICSQFDIALSVRASAAADGRDAFILPKKTQRNKTESWRFSPPLPLSFSLPLLLLRRGDLGRRLALLGQAVAVDLALLGPVELLVLLFLLFFLGGKREVEREKGGSKNFFAKG